jgi:hypothetical protein
VEENTPKMPRKSRATRARLQNLSKRKKKDKKKDINDNYGKSFSHPSHSQTSETLLPQTAVFVEPDALDTLDPLDVPGDTMPKEDDDDEGSCVEILDGGSDAVDICEESELAKFSRILFTAQKRATEAETARGKKRKTYTGHSQKTAYRRKRYRDHLATQGYLPVQEFMKLMESRKTAQERTPSQNLTVLPFEESEESSDDDAVTASEGTSMELAPAVNEDCHQVTQGPVASEQHYQAVQELREEEEESTESEGEGGGTTREDRQDLGSRNGTHLGAAPFRHRV